MTQSRLETVLHLLDPPKGRRLWYGGASLLGSVRGLSPEVAAWKPSRDRHSIWELTLHIAYWKYAVRRMLDGSPKGTFPRGPANWPEPPSPPTADAWKTDRALLRDEHQRLLAVTRTVEPALLDERAPESGKWTIGDMLIGVVTHDIYHVGQIQLLKRLHSNRRK